MVEREKIIQLARECGLNTLVIDLFVNNFYHAAQKKAFEQAAKVCETDGIGTKYQGDVYAIVIRQLIKD